MHLTNSPTIRAQRDGPTVIVSPTPGFVDTAAAFLGMIAQAHAVIGPKAVRGIDEVIFITPLLPEGDCALHHSLKTFADQFSERCSTRGIRISAVQGNVEKIR